MDKSTWMTTGDIARLCHVDRKTVARWCDAGVLRCFRVAGGQRRIEISEWQRFREEELLKARVRAK